MATGKRIVLGFDPSLVESPDAVLQMVGRVVREKQEAENQMSKEQQVREAFLTVLAQLGNLTTSEDAIVFEGDKLILPASYEGRVQDAIEYLGRYHEAQETHYQHSRVFKYRPWDGANTFQQTLYRYFGTTGIGKETFSFFFGSRPPQMHTISTGVNTTVQVPWGQVEFPPLEATFTLAATRDRELGDLFALSVDAPKKYRKHIAALFDLIERELTINSIYRGKAINGAGEPGFLDLSGVDPKKVVYSDDVLVQLEANLWSLLKYPEVMRQAGLSLKRSVLVEGIYGSGKTLAGYLTAQEAVANGWTFILCRPGQDDLFTVLRTAQLYAPSVVWFEDLDILAKGGSDEEISKLLDALDGLQGKGVEVIAGFTTNHVHAIQKGVLRPGRLDAIIHIGGLDANGYRKLVPSLIPEQFLGDIDYEKLVTAFEGYAPAFVTEAITSAMRFTIARTGGVLDVITTEDIVNGAEMLRPQFELMSGAGEGANQPTLDSVLRDTLVDVVNHTQFQYDADENQGLAYNEDRELED